MENQAAYPGLKEAAQYFGPLTEVAKAQGFTMDEDPTAEVESNERLAHSNIVNQDVWETGGH